MLQECAEDVHSIVVNSIRVGLYRVIPETGVTGHFSRPPDEVQSGSSRYGTPGLAGNQFCAHGAFAFSEDCRKVGCCISIGAWRTRHCSASRLGACWRRKREAGRPRNMLAAKSQSRCYNVRLSWFGKSYLLSTRCATNVLYRWGIMCSNARTGQLLQRNNVKATSVISSS
jgi:hypothetical protein